MALATSANIGSVATLVGNPQNMIIGHLSQISFVRFSMALVPVAVIGLAINYFVLRIGFRRAVGGARIDPGRGAEAAPTLDRRLMVMAFAALALVFVGFVAGLNLAWTALAGAAIIMVLARRDTH